MDLNQKRLKKATISDVAARAGVAVGTVSRYLNGETLRRANRERIETAITDLHFKRNLAAASVRRNQSKVIGFILPHFDEFHVEVLNLLTQELRREGYVILPYLHGSTNIKLTDARDYFNEHRIDLLITSGDVNFASQSHILEEMGVPVVLYSNDVLGLEVDRVMLQDQRASFDATSHLLDMGHQNVAILRGNMGDSSAQDRFAGFAEALLKRGVNFDLESQAAGDGWMEGHGYEGTQALLESRKPPSAIFCSNYLLTKGFFRYVKERGMKIGEDISLISFGDSEYFPFIGNGISAVRLPDQKIARSLLEFSMSRLNGESPLRRTISHDCDMILRGSVANLNG